MTGLVVLLAIIALCGAISASRQTTRTLRAWQMALDAVRPQPQPPTRECSCRCHPVVPTTRHTWN
jgi:hypothetical protein